MKRALDEPDLDRVGREHRPVRSSRQSFARRSRARAAAAAELVRRDVGDRRGRIRSARARTTSVPSASRIAPSSSCTRLPGPDDLASTSQLPERDRAQELVGDAGDRQPVEPSRPLERAHQQRRRARRRAARPGPTVRARARWRRSVAPSWTKTTVACWLRGHGGTRYRPATLGTAMSDHNGTAARRGDIHRQGRPGRDAQGRRDHGRGHPRAGEDRRGRRRRRGDGARARPRRHPPRRRRGADVATRR